MDDFKRCFRRVNFYCRVIGAKRGYGSFMIGFIALFEIKVDLYK